ncbi:MAG: hypothetical protein QOF58_3612 [Pseudonocardiales bacterium]|nr:hypothetical protein [Pseudonocardiales bacterium]
MNIPVAATLTAEDIVALNAANVVTFMFDAATGTAVARAALQRPVDPDLDALFPEDGQNHEMRARVIACAVEITGYGCGGRFDMDWSERDAISTVCRARVARANPFWSTVLHLLKPGDRLRQQWFSERDNGVLYRAGLIKDELAVQVERDASPALRFHLCHHITALQDSRRLVVRGVVSSDTSTGSRHAIGTRP